MELIDHHGAPGVVVPLDSPYMAAAARAIEHGFGRHRCTFAKGARFPIVTTFHEQLGVDTLLLGWGLNDDNTHSPNEKFCLADYPPRHHAPVRTCGKNSAQDIESPRLPKRSTS